MGIAADYSRLFADAERLTTPITVPFPIITIGGKGTERFILTFI